MKHLLFFKLALFLSFVANAGNDSGSGGDIYGKEFQTISGELLAVLKENRNQPIIKERQIDLHRLELEISRTVIRTSEKVYLEGREVDAAKFPPTPIAAGLIELSRSRWRKKNLLKRIELSAHEYMGILGLERNNYEVSIDLTEFIIATYNRLKKNPLLEVDLYYGYREHVSTLQSPRSRSVICDPSLPDFLDSLEEAKNEALTACRAYRTDCALLAVETKPVISIDYPGYRFCEITAVAK